MRVYEFCSFRSGLAQPLCFNNMRLIFVAKSLFVYGEGNAKQLVILWEKFSDYNLSQKLVRQ